MGTSFSVYPIHSIGCPIHYAGMCRMQSRRDICWYRKIDRRGQPHSTRPVLFCEIASYFPDNRGREGRGPVREKGGGVPKRILFFLAAPPLICPNPFLSRFLMGYHERRSESIL